MFKWLGSSCCLKWKKNQKSIEMEEEQSYEMHSLQPKPVLLPTSSNRQTFRRMRNNLPTVCELQEMVIGEESAQTSRQSEETSYGSSTTFSDEGSSVVQPSCSRGNALNTDREMASASQWNFFAFLEGRPISKKANNCDWSIFDEQMEENKKLSAQKSLQKNCRKNRLPCPY